MPNLSPDVRKIDKLLDQFPQEEQFINFVQSPEYSEALRAAVPYLIEQWPTAEQIQILDDIQKNPNRAPNLLDRRLVANLKTGRNLAAIDNYNAQKVSPADNAKIFWTLSENRPWRDDTLHRWKDSVDDTFGSSLFLISRS